jgi:transposase-like protein
VKREALDLVEQGVPRVEISRRLGMTTESIRSWVNAAQAEGTFPQPGGNDSKPPTLPPAATGAPAPEPSRPAAASPDRPSGLGEHEVEAILDLKKRHPVMGPAQIRAQLKLKARTRTGPPPLPPHLRI